MTYDPQCQVCDGFLFGDVDPCDCGVHQPEQIAAALRHVADTMQRMTVIMRDSSGFSDSERAKLLRQHAAEMQGAAELCIEWAENLESY